MYIYIKIILDLELETWKKSEPFGLKITILDKEIGSINPF